MIIVAGQMAMNGAVVDEMRIAIAAMRGKVLAEAGCHQYSLLVEDEAEGVFNVVEMWDDDAALATHMQQPWIADFLKRFGHEIRRSDVQIYDIAAVRPLPDLA